MLHAYNVGKAFLAFQRPGEPIQKAVDRFNTVSERRLPGYVVMCKYSQFAKLIEKYDREDIPYNSRASWRTVRELIPHGAFEYALRELPKTKVQPTPQNEDIRCSDPQPTNTHSEIRFDIDTDTSDEIRFDMGTDSSDEDGERKMSG